MFKLYNFKKKRGLSPGSMVFTGEQKIQNVKISVLSFKEGKCVEKEISDPAELKVFKENNETSWINITGLHDINLLENIRDMFNIHPLVMEDILNVHHSPKIDDFNDFLFMIVKMISYDDKTDYLDIEQVSIIHCKNFVITFQEKEGDVFDPIRERIRNNKGRISKLGNDYLVYRLIDIIVDNYFLVLENFDEKIETIEDDILDNPDESSLESIHTLRKKIIKFKRAVSPIREIISTIDKEKFSIINKETYLFLRDLSDHVKQILETIENYREIINGLLDVYLSSASHKMNEVVKLLTIISTIFIPLTFIAGIYGMNFSTGESRWNMPELNWAFGYPFVLGIMFIIAVSLIFFFKRKGWFK